MSRHLAVLAGLAVVLTLLPDTSAAPIPGLFIRHQPQDVAAAPGDRVTFRVDATGAPPLWYQWRLDGSPLAGGVAATFQVAGATVAWAGGYDVIVRNDAGAVTSRLARIDVQIPSPAQRTHEPPGPSSRRTGIAISEILLRPPAREDRRQLAFVELHNSNPFFEDLSGWRLSGAFDFTFPPRTILAGNAYLVVVAAPDDLAAVHGITNVIGGFAPPAPHASGTVRVWKRSGAKVLEVECSDEDPWPAAAFGPGHSLVLARPSFGESDPRAWAASARLGGSPGQPDPLPAGPLEWVVLNEILVQPDGMRVLDAVRFRGQASGIALGRDPADRPPWSPLHRPTPGTANAGPLAPPVIINELLYHPPSEQDADEFIALFNPGSEPVSLAGWRFTDGVDFEFPSTASTAPDRHRPRRPRSQSCLHHAHLTHRQRQVGHDPRQGALVERARRDRRRWILHGAPPRPPRGAVDYT